MIEACISRYVAEKGIKQSAIARAIGKPKQTIQKVMTGKRRITVPEYFAVCDFLEVPYEKFVNEARGEGASRGEGDQRPALL